MLRLENLVNVYAVFPTSADDFGAIKSLNLPNTDADVLTTYFLIEAERFWMATLLQLLGCHHLYKGWLNSWAEVTLYYAQFFERNNETLRANNNTYQGWSLSC